MRLWVWGAAWLVGLVLSLGCDSGEAEPEGQTVDAGEPVKMGAIVADGGERDAGGAVPDAGVVPDGGGDAAAIDQQRDAEPVDAPDAGVDAAAADACAAPCVQPDPCAAASGGCDPLTTCTVLGGGRACGPCPSGYDGAGETGCTDIDECSLEVDSCSSLAGACVNIAGGYDCVCPAGYAGDGQGEAGCVSTDPCATDNGGCEERCIAAGDVTTCACGPDQELAPDGRTCLSWQPARVFDELGATPRVTRGAPGSVIVAWSRSTGLRTQAWAQRYIDGTWEPAARINQGDLASADHVDVAANASGTAFAVWQGKLADGRTRVWGNRFANGSWGSPSELDDGSSGNAATFPQVAVDGAGNAFAAWEQSNGTRYDVWASRYSAGSWSAPFKLEADDAGDARHPDVAADAAGNATVVWHQYGATTARVWARRYAAGQWQTATDNEDPALIGYALNPRIATNAQGTFVALWVQSDGSPSSIWAARLSSNGWEGSTRISNRDGKAVSAPQLAVNAAGSVFALWEAMAGTRTDVWANHYAGDSWSSALMLSEASSNGGAFPQIAADDSGTAWALWVGSERGLQSDVWTRRFEAIWKPPTKTDDDAVGYRVSPSIAMDGLGEPFAVWQQSLGATNVWQVAGNRYE